MYRVDLTPAAERGLRRLPRDERRRLEPVILGLEREPRPKGAIKLTGTRNVYRIRVGPFRVLYEIDEMQQVVIITKVARRSERTYRF